MTTLAVFPRTHREINWELAQCHRAGDANAAWELAWRNRGLIPRVAAYYAKRYGVPYEDLYQEGLLSLKRSAETYLPDSFAFSTYAVRRLQMHLRCIAQEQRSIIRVPRPTQNGRVDAKLVEQGYRMLASCQLIPTSEECARMPAEPALAADERAQLNRFLDWLSPRERQVVLMRSEGATFREVGEAIGYSHEQARSFYKHALAILRALYRERGFE